MISHSHRTVFVHIPKCGGQSIEAAFLADLALTWELRAPLLLRPNDDPRLGPPRLAHLLARDYARYHYLSDELFKSYYSFSVLRDPVARVVSLFNYLRPRDPKHRALSFDAFLYDWLARQFEFKAADSIRQNATTNSFHFVRPQVDFVTDTSGRVMVDDLFLLEGIDAALPTIRQRAQLRSPLEHRNKSVAHIRRDKLRPEQEAFIRTLYACDVAFIAATFQTAGP